MLVEHLNSALGKLDAREQEVLRLRYGIDGEAPRTLELIGERFQLTRERIRQIEWKALRKLRHPRLAGHLRDFAAPGRGNASLSRGDSGDGAKCRRGAGTHPCLVEPTASRRSLGFAAAGGLMLARPRMAMGFRETLRQPSPSRERTSRDRCR